MTSHITVRSVDTLIQRISKDYGDRIERLETEIKQMKVEMMNLYAGIDKYYEC
jgi:uncharacterized protein (UPF0335 family)